MGNYTPKSAKEDKFELYNVVYSAAKDEDLKNFFENRNSIKWIPYVKIENKDEYYFKALPKIDYKIDVIEWINDFKNKYNSDIYSFIQDKTFTLIIFDSRDLDSILTKDIIVKQYQTVYKRNTENWKEDGVIIYDINNNETLFPTIDGKYYFNFDSLKENAIDEIFLCGYNVDSNLIKQFIKSNEKVFVFESNPLKVNIIKSLGRGSDSIKYCMQKNELKSYQAYTLFRDPIGNIKNVDNKALEILKDYSNMCNCLFNSVDEWKELEKVKYWFEEKIQDTTWKEKFINCLFGDNDINLEFERASIKNIKDNANFEEALKLYSYEWTGNTIAVNTREIPTYNQVKKIIVDEKKYSKIIIFYKADPGFWSLLCFKLDRELTGGVSIDKADAIDPKTKLQNTWYTENGIPVVKVDNLYEIFWYNMSGKHPVFANYYELDLENGNYVFDTKNRKYVQFKWNDETASNRYPLVNGKKFNDALYLNNTWQTYSLSNNPRYIVFNTVYPDKDVIDFNKISLIELLRNKYYCQGNKYFVNCSLTDKQLYECLKTKSI